jgi:hypothetical protein
MIKNAEWPSHLIRIELPPLMLLNFDYTISCFVFPINYTEVINSTYWTLLWFQKKKSETRCSNLLSFWKTARFNSYGLETYRCQ